MWFVMKGFKIFPQQASVKYKFLERIINNNDVQHSALTFRQSTNNKTLGQYFVMKNFID